MTNFIKFIEENNILNKWQSGFRPGYSTETAMTYVTDLLLTEMDSKKLIGVGFFLPKKGIRYSGSCTTPY